MYGRDHHNTIKQLSSHKKRKKEKKTYLKITQSPLHSLYCPNTSILSFFNFSPATALFNPGIKLEVYSAEGHTESAGNRSPGITESGDILLKDREITQNFTHWILRDPQTPQWMLAPRTTTFHRRSLLWSVDKVKRKAVKTVMAEATDKTADPITQWQAPSPRTRSAYSFEGAPVCSLSPSLLLKLHHPAKPPLPHTNTHTHSTYIYAGVCA